MTAIVFGLGLLTTPYFGYTGDTPPCRLGWYSVLYGYSLGTIPVLEVWTPPQSHRQAPMSLQHFASSITDLPAQKTWPKLLRSDLYFQFHHHHSPPSPTTTPWGFLRDSRANSSHPQYVVQRGVTAPRSQGAQRSAVHPGWFHGWCR